MNRRNAARYLLRGLVGFLLFLLICVIIRPLGLTINEGFSYYVDFSNTLLPFILAFLIDIYFIFKAASVIDDRTKADRYAGLSLKIIAVLLFGLLITPHLTFPLVHHLVGAAMFIFQLILGFILVNTVRKNRTDIVLLIGASIGGISSLIFLPMQNGFMIEAQIIFQICIWTIFIRYLNNYRVRR
jgi:hypothetical protein